MVENKCLEVFQEVENGKKKIMHNYMYHVESFGVLFLSSSVIYGCGK